MSTYILGLHIGHDATSAVIDGEGNVLAAMAEERITRIKYHMGFPYDGIDEVLKQAGLSTEDIDHVVLSTERQIFPDTPDYNKLFLTRDKAFIKESDYFNRPLDSFGTRVLKVLKSKVAGGSGGYAPGEVEAYSLEQTKKLLAEVGLGHAEVTAYDHHHCHATSAYYLSGTKDALIITMDGAGDGHCATASIAENGVVKRVSGAADGISPGRFYSEITGFVGFKRLRHEGKITGLAAYGDPDKYYDQLKAFIRFDPATEQFTYDESLRSDGGKMQTLRRMRKGINAALPHVADLYEYLEANFDPEKDMRDLAAAAQRILEELAVEYVSHFLKNHPTKNVLMAGGVFANVRVNQYIAEIPGVDFVYIHQNMGDGGLALGGAMAHLHEALGKENTCIQPTHVYYGNSYTNDEIKAALDAEGITYTFHEDVEKEIARLIHDGKVIGRFNGGMEYGPRALGNRSIIASTVDRTINQWLNDKLNRTEFMPFAPSMLADRAGEMLVDYDRGVSDYADRFMTITYHVKDEWHDRLQATTHVDGTARPQVVFEEGNASYYRIIKEYDALSGIPAIINTSFNMHEEPIVRTPQDAIRSFAHGCLDHLAIGNYICAFDENFD